ncbi:hypothetical protein EDB89DRAFT_1988271 [Lactarius sanguifluus]|nr:hypothetical protein EDB89DRAFT_1988271 [Lactarius sanguifluus]
MTAFNLLLWGQVQVQILAPWPLWLRLLYYQALHDASRRGFSRARPWVCSLSTAALMEASLCPLCCATCSSSI